MRIILAAGILTAALAATSTSGFAAPAGSTQTTAKSSSHASHATTGTVRSIDDTKLVIVRPGKKGEMAFSVSPSTHREGTVAVGSKVSVRYEQNGQTRMATAISAAATSDSKKGTAASASAGHGAK
jgi:hypothetical protein